LVNLTGWRKVGRGITVARSLRKARETAGPDLLARVVRSRGAKTADEGRRTEDPIRSQGPMPMTDHSHSDPYADRGHRHHGASRGQWHRTGERLRDYLRTRPAECWYFFAAGLIVGAILT
jgi:hypothetical protein